MCGCSWHLVLEIPPRGAAEKQCEDEADDLQSDGSGDYTARERCVLFEAFPHCWETPVRVESLHESPQTLHLASCFTHNRII